MRTYQGLESGWTRDSALTNDNNVPTSYTYQTALTMPAAGARLRATIVSFNQDGNDSQEEWAEATLGADVQSPDGSSSNPPTPPTCPEPVRFDRPRYNGYALDRCKLFGDQPTCNEPAASYWCQLQGFASAAAYEVKWSTQNDWETTIVPFQSTQAKPRLCGSWGCDSFKFVVCQMACNQPQS